MSFKIVKTGNALVITDTVKGKDIVDIPSNNIYYDLDALQDNSVIKLLVLDVSASLGTRIPAIPLSDAIDSGDASFTINSFKTFARTNLG